MDPSWSNTGGFCRFHVIGLSWAIYQTSPVWPKAWWGRLLLGALGMETIGLTWYSHFGTDTNYQLFVIVEESLEMLGIAIALCALIYSVGYKVEEDGSLSLRLFLKEGDN